MPKVDSPQEFSGQLYGWFKSLALSIQHQTTNLQARKKIDFSQKYGDLYGPEEGKDSGVKGLAELEAFEGEELTLTGHCGYHIEEETEKESKEDDSEEEGFLGAENIEESDPELKELLQNSESDIENTEQEQEKESEEGFVIKIGRPIQIRF